MKVKVKVDVDPAKILKARGLGVSNEARIYLASQVKNRADKYVPMSSGAGAHMKNNAKISSDGSTLTYPGPYAHYLYKGEVMGPNYLGKDGKWHSGKAPKKYTGRELTYHGAPMRGKQWIPRMMADQKDELVKDFAAFVDSKGK